MVSKASSRSHRERFWAVGITLRSFKKRELLESNNFDLRILVNYCFDTAITSKRGDHCFHDLNRKNSELKLNPVSACSHRVGFSIYTLKVVKKCDCAVCNPMTFVRQFLSLCCAVSEFSSCDGTLVMKVLRAFSIIINSKGVVPPSHLNLFSPLGWHNADTNLYLQ